MFNFTQTSRDKTEGEGGKNEVRDEIRGKDSKELREKVCGGGERFLLGRDQTGEAVSLPPGSLGGDVPACNRRETH